MTEYSEAFKSKMVQRMSGPRAKTATALAPEVGVPQPTLSRWLRTALRSAIWTSAYPGRSTVTDAPIVEV